MSGWERNQREPFWATALSRMTPAGQRLARGIDRLIRRSPALAPWAWVGSGWRLVSTVPTASVPEHQTGRALDVIFGETGRRPTPQQRALANQLVDALIRNHKAIGIQWIIWSPDGKDRPMSWSASRGTWKALAGRGSISGNHIDHAHIYLTAAGAGWASALDKLTIGTTTTATPIPVPEEDDIMAMTPAERSALVDDIAQASTTKLLLAQLGASGPSVGVALQGTNQSVVALRGEIAGLTVALGQLATGHVDLEAISAAARDGARQALTDARITVDLGPSA